MYTFVVLCLALSWNELQIFVGFVLRAADEVELDNKKLNKKEILAQPRGFHSTGNARTIVASVRRN